MTCADTTADVIERYQRMVYAICLTHTKHRMDADDAFQEVFLAYHRKQPLYRDEEHRKAWLIRTTLNLCRRTATSTWRTRVIPVDPSQSEALVDEVFRFSNPVEDRLFEALAGLPASYRTVIHLFYFEDLPIAQIAEVLGGEPGAIKMRLSRGRAMLREAMTMEDSHA